MNKLIEAIEQLKKARKAIILAHVYQPSEIQDIADHTGDSLELSRLAAETDAEVIVFCGVHFMAETANILSPEKITLLPVDAGCRMADTITAAALAKKRAEKPDAAVVAYVNTPADVKALSDICCTSANAAQVIASLPEAREIIFVPDKNLASYVQRETGRRIDCWPGACPIHDRLTLAEIRAVKAQHPDALILAHPECHTEILLEADYIGGTVGIVRYAKASDAQEFIIATERGVLYQLEKECPGKKFYLAAAHMICADMKRTTLESVKKALENLQPRIVVPEDIRKKASDSLKKMLDICQ